MSANLSKNILPRNPICTMLIGPPACGKSTYRASMLISLVGEGHDPVIISGDDLIEAEAKSLGKTYSEVFPSVDFKLQKKILRGAFEDAIARNADIIIDRTNMTIKGRRSFLATLPKNYTKIAVVFSFNYDELLERLDRRGSETGKYIPHKVVKEMTDRFQAPTMAEFHQIQNVNSFLTGP